MNDEGFCQMTCADGAHRPREVVVVAGTGTVRYALEGDVLTVYVGAGLTSAPEHATSTVIEPGYTTWVMRFAGAEGEAPPDHESFVEIRARGLAAVRRDMESRRRSALPAAAQQPEEDA